MEKTGVIYGLYCQCEKCDSYHPGWVRYVGQTVVDRPSRRLDQHRFESRSEGAYLSVHLWMRKHGEYNVEMRILESDVLAKDLNDRETHWIAEMRTFRGDGNGGLNLTRDGLGSEITDKSRKRQQEAMRKTRARIREELITRNRPGMTEREVVDEIRTRYITDPDLGVPEISRDYGLKDLHLIRNILRNTEYEDPGYTPPEKPNKPSFYARATRGLLSETERQKWDEVCEIRRIWLEGNLTSYQVGEMFGLNHQTIWHIVNNRTREDPTYVNTRGRKVPDHVRDVVAGKLRGVPKPEGFGKKGSSNVKSKLTDETVIEILDRLAAGAKGIDLAEEYGVTPSTISRLRLGKTWTYLPRPEGLK